MTVIYDIETLKKCFTYTAFDFKDNKWYQFVLHDQRFELNDLMGHLKQCLGQIGYNNIDFDYPVLHFMFKNYRDWDTKTNQEVIDLIYAESQRLIEDKTFGENNFKNYIKPGDYYIRQLDLFKIHHFNNPARKQSLKGLEINMNMDNVMDMPISHDCETILVEQIDDILAYNKHDVEATYQFYLKTLDKIELRKQLSKIYNLPDLINANDVKIGEQIFLKLLSEEMRIPKWDLRKMRTKRDSVNFNEIILPYIEFKNPKLRELLQDFKNTTITETKNGFKKSVILGGVKIEYGQGGVHACIKSGVYESSDTKMILDIDVKSFYPNIAVSNKFKPEHLGEIFTNIYSDIYKQRTQIPKTDPRNAAFKLMLNGCFGKAGDKNSFLKDDKFLLSITVNGQLLLTMLIDELLSVQNLEILQINTDGASIRIDIKDLDKVNEICKQWELKTKLELEYQEYTKMVIRDVNNYLTGNSQQKSKYKGAFKARNEMISDGEWHKDFSFNIVPLALSEYFLTGKPVELTIEEHRDIFDFCGRKKFDKNSWGEEHFITLDENNNPVKQVNKLQKNVRYYITNKGSSFVKQYTKGKWQFLNLGYQITVFNKFVEKSWEDYNIDYSFYISECYKEIHQIESKQLQLF